MSLHWIWVPCLGHVGIRPLSHRARTSSRRAMRRLFDRHAMSGLFALVPVCASPCRPTGFSRPYAVAADHPPAG
jgi:hypothetical protein